mmetsp:Transcript_8255/g.27455  ORF Transcript_8255/g.27455 Transcript_8255/m.27455 type:complete len:303 (+) Transcript_8255:1339-2247(+)
MHRLLTVSTHGTTATAPQSLRLLIERACRCVGDGHRSLGFPPSLRSHPRYLFRLHGGLSLARLCHPAPAGRRRRILIHTLLACHEVRVKLRLCQQKVETLLLPYSLSILLFALGDLRLHLLHPFEQLPLVLLESSLDDWRILDKLPQAGRSRRDELGRSDPLAEHHVAARLCQLARGCVRSTMKPDVRLPVRRDVAPGKRHPRGCLLQPLANFLLVAKPSLLKRKLLVLHRRRACSRRHQRRAEHLEVRSGWRRRRHEQRPGRHVAVHRRNHRRRRWHHHLRPWYHHSERREPAGRGEEPAL